MKEIKQVIRVRLLNGIRANVFRLNGSAFPPLGHFHWTIGSQKITALRLRKAAERVANGRGGGSGVTGTMVEPVKTLWVVSVCVAAAIRPLVDRV
jgi:hypothetical protein